LTTTYAYASAANRAQELPSSVYGPNGTATATAYEYDTWGRLLKVIRPGDSSARPTTEYVYYDATRPLSISVYSRVTSGSDTELATFSYYNGLGQLLQTKQGASSGSDMIVTSVTYNEQGQKKEEYLPYYLGSYSTLYTALDTSKPRRATATMPWAGDGRHPSRCYRRHDLLPGAAAGGAR